jgi:hypothetical protein
VGPEHERSGEPAAVGNPSRDGDGNRIDGIDDLRDKRHRSHARRHSLTAGLASLGDDEVDLALGRVARLRVAWKRSRRAGKRRD